MARHGADAPLWGDTAATFLAAIDMWDEAARADREGGFRTQAILNWRPSTRARYRSAITQLVETERQRPNLGLQEVLAESLAMRSGQGQSAWGMCGIFVAVRALKDLCILPPTVLPLHRRIAGGGSQPKGQDYATPPMLREIWSAASTDQQRVVAALRVLSWVCFLRVGEAARIRPCDVEDASLVFFRSKPKQQGWHRRPLARYPVVWARWLPQLRLRSWRRLGCSVRRWGCRCPGARPGRAVGGYPLEGLRVALLPEGRGRRILGPQAERAVLQMVGRVDVYPHSDAVCHGVQRPRGTRAVAAPVPFVRVGGEWRRGDYQLHRSVGRGHVRR